MLQRILVALDGSQLAEQALACAERLAAASSAQLILLRVVPFDIIQPPEDDFALADESRAYLRRTAGDLTARGLAVKAITKWGHPDKCILEELATRRAGLVVMGTHGRSAPGRWLYGSVADAVLRASPVPVIVVPPPASVPSRLERILVALDGSALSEASLPSAIELAAACAAELVLLAVVPMPPYALYDEGAALAAFDPGKEIDESEAYLNTVAKRLRKLGIYARTRVELAKPEVSIAGVAAQEKAGLIAMATHGRSGLARLVLGSVATGALQRSSVPVLFVGPAALNIHDDQHQLVSAAGTPGRRSCDADVFYDHDSAGSDAG